MKINFDVNDIQEIEIIKCPCGERWMLNELVDKVSKEKN